MKRVDDKQYNQFLIFLKWFRSVKKIAISSTNTIVLKVNKIFCLISVGNVPSMWTKKRHTAYDIGDIYK